MALQERIEIEEGPGKYDILLHSLLEGKVVTFGLKARPKENSMCRDIEVRITSVSRHPKSKPDGLCQVWVVEGVVAVDGAFCDVPKNTKFQANFDTHIRRGMSTLTFPETDDPNQNWIRS